MPKVLEAKHILKTTTVGWTSMGSYGRACMPWGLAPEEVERTTLAIDREQGLSGQGVGRDELSLRKKQQTEKY